MASSPNFILNLVLNIIGTVSLSSPCPA